MTERRQSFKAVAMTASAFAVCFACWVINSVLITALTSWGTFSFTDGQVGWLLAAPVLTGALGRLPAGLLADRFGGRQVLIGLMLAAAIPLFLLSFATTYSQFLIASFGFGLAGASFAACVAYISTWFEKSRQGTALGMLGVGNAGAAATTLLAPTLLGMITVNGAHPERWRLLPQLFAAALVLMAFIFWLATTDRRGPALKKTLRSQFDPLRDITVWRFGLYYVLMFGGFIALAQWIVPYTLNTYRLTLTQAGLIASVFSLPAGLVRAAGGWLSDRFGALTVMYYVFAASVIACLLLSVPRMDVQSPGEGISAKAPGIVTSVSNNSIAIGARTYPLTPQPAAAVLSADSILPSVTRWHSAAVAPGDKVTRKQLIAAGVTRIFYPSGIWVFTGLILIMGISMGVGSAAVYRLIPDQFPTSVGIVGGTVGLLGGLGGFIFPPIFGSLLHSTGLWSSCWLVLAGLGLICLVWMHVVARGVVSQQAPELVQLLERPPSPGSPAATSEQQSLTRLLKQIPWFAEFSAAELQGIERIGRTATASGDEYLFREGEPGDSLYLILSGSVDVVRLGDDGTEIGLASLTQGDFFGELAIIDGSPRSASVRARETTELFLLPRRDFLSLLAKSPRMLADLLIGLSGKVRHINAQYYEAAIQHEKLRVQQEINRLRSMGEMIAGLAHEINTPLGIVNHASSIIEERLDSTEPDAKDDIRDASKLIQDGIGRADRLVKTFKNLSVSQVSDSRATTGIRKLIDECITLYSLKARASRLKIAVEDHLGLGDGEWEGFPGHFSQIILNLLTNADRYAYPDGTGGEVRIILSAIQNDYRIVVQDFGKGIREEDLPHIFDPFFTTGRHKGGTGLGMAIVRNLVSGSLHGDIRLESAVDKGTSVKLTVPRVVVAPPGQAEQARVQRSSS